MSAAAWPSERNAQRKRGRKCCSSNERTDELANDGARLDGGVTAQIRASTVQQKREEVYAALQCAASFHCMMEEWHDCEKLKPGAEGNVDSSGQQFEAKKLRTEGCAAASKYRCMRCGRNSKKMKMPGPKVVGEGSQSRVGKMGKAHVRGHDKVRRVDPDGEALVCCKKCCAVPSWAEVDEPLQTRKRHEIPRGNVENHPQT